MGREAHTIIHKYLWDNGLRCGGVGGDKERGGESATNAKAEVDIAAICPVTGKG